MKVNIDPEVTFVSEAHFGVRLQCSHIAGKCNEAMDRRSFKG